MYLKHNLVSSSFENKNISYLLPLQNITFQKCQRCS